MAETSKCPRCGGDDHDLMACPDVKAAEFGADGGISRVEFMTPADHGVRIVREGALSMQEPADYPRLKSAAGGG